MFHEIHQAEASADVSGHNASFISRAADFFLRCVSKKKIRGQGPELEELFLHYGLEDYPYKTSNESSSSSPSPTNLTRIVGMLDRELGLAAIFQPSLTTARRRKQANSVVLFIDAPESTPSMRLKDHVGQDDKDSLLRKIIASFALLKPRSRKLRKEAAQVLAIDEQLSSVIQMRNELPSAGHSLASSVSAETSNNGNLVRGALMSVSSLAKDYGNQAWSWDEYVHILMGDIVFKENATGEPRVLVQVDSPGQLQQLVSLLDDHQTSALLNYVAFSLTVFLSPALPPGGIAQELITLSHRGTRTSGDACLNMRRSNPSFRAKGSKNTTTSSVSSRSRAAPSLLEEYVIRQNATNALYWSDPERAEENLEDAVASAARQATGRLLRDAKHSAHIPQPGFPSYPRCSLASTLWLYPSWDPTSFAALLSVVVGSQQSSDVGTTSQQDSAVHSVSMSRHREEATRCLAEQYANLTGDRKASARSSDLFVDTAVVEPLFELYRTNLAKGEENPLTRYPELRDGPNIVELPGKNSLELFFVNYAVAHCEHAPRLVDLAASTDSDRALSPAARLNVALMNSRQRKQSQSVHVARLDMRPPDDSSRCPSPEEKLSPRLWRRRLIFTLPGERAAELYCGDSVSHDRQDSSCQVFEACTESSHSRKRSSVFPTSPSSDVLVQPGAKRQRTYDDEHTMRCFTYACGDVPLR
ncbi:hypothetical protein HPB51_015834 [Rhipicephalus microplus]|uniref:Peptidase M13 N-terminal domain-containing protein n=1 Tax=Rhipicephalus microplus TaxID=6941 RepID=A0A9J6F5V5_RHIMP|nr:hypothetical protein HPB51_015834 [Rhipicephalus microplus]